MNDALYASTRDGAEPGQLDWAASCSAQSLNRGVFDRLDQYPPRQLVQRARIATMSTSIRHLLGKCAGRNL
jgi:hypothetical protein